MAGKNLNSITAGKTDGRIRAGLGKRGAAGRRIVETDKITRLLPCIFLGVLTIICCLIFTGSQNVFGVKVDWLSQENCFRSLQEI